MALRMAFSLTGGLALRGPGTECVYVEVAAVFVLLRNRSCEIAGFSRLAVFLFLFYLFFYGGFSALHTGKSRKWEGRELSGI